MSELSFEPGRLAQSAPSRAGVNAGVLSVVFGATLFASAFLLFWIEPLFARILLPRLGGSHGVWNTCLVFYQAFLLAGYAYADGIARRLPVRFQVPVHLLVMAVGVAFLPVALASEWIPPADGSPVLPLLGLLAVTLGWPFFALSANAPLLQHWYAQSRHKEPVNPYVLYAASNAGSLAALLAFPVLIEPNVTLGGQTAAWMWGYIALITGLAIAGAATLFSGATDVARVEAGAIARPSWRTKMAWLVYAAIPSSLLIGVTGYITTDVASFPLIWLAPLALYLLTFVFVFAGRPPIPHALVVRALPWAIVLAACGFWLGPLSLAFALAAQFLAFFIVAMALHGEVARRKPEPAALTQFFFWLSLGGVVGGAATALVSPLIFNAIIEYPLALAAACILCPGAKWRGVKEALLLSAAAIAVLAEPAASAGPIASAGLSALGIAVALGCGLRRGFNPLTMALAFFLALHTTAAISARDGEIVWRGRSFYGAYVVTEDKASNYRRLYHGTTMHGVERMNAAKPEPLSYYAARGPLGDIMAAIGPGATDIGVVGLGAGSSGCYAAPNQRWTFYEIDALVEEIVARSGMFHLLDACAPQAKIVLGDGRLNLERESAAQYDLLMVDAFSSDAIPVHLITREAFLSYMRALKPGGALAMHISNRNLDLHPIVAAIAAEAGLVSYARSFAPPKTADLTAASPSEWVVLARNDADLGALTADPRWKRQAAPKAKAWTDDFSNILSALR